MMDDFVAILDLAEELQVRKQTIFKVLKRLNIQSTQRRESSRRNQNIAGITSAAAALVRDELQRGRAGNYEADSSVALPTPIYYSDDVGVFYLIQLEPDHDPARFKVGFTAEIEGRLRTHRCSAPFARCLKTWPCRRTWERAAIDCVTGHCEQLHTEVFRAPDLDSVLSRAETFLSVMPSLTWAIGDVLDDEPDCETTPS